MEEEQKEAPSFLDVPKDIPIATASLPTIRTNNAGFGSSSDRSNPIDSPAISFTPHLYSPSPPSSAFVSALQSPYISPRVLDPPPPPQRQPYQESKASSVTTTTAQSPASCSNAGSQSEDTDAPSASRTPPSERYDSSGIDPAKISDGGGGGCCGAPPRVSF
jgi:hypothetical protein